MHLRHDQYTHAIQYILIADGSQYIYPLNEAASAQPGQYAKFRRKYELTSHVSVSITITIYKSQLTNMTKEQAHNTRG